MSTLRTVEFHIDKRSWKGQPIPRALLQLDKIGNITTDVDDALLFLSWLTWPPNFLGFSLAECWAWRRYKPAIDAGQWLHLRDEWTELDPHQKTVLSDDFGVGFSASILSDHLGFVEYADARWALLQATYGLRRPAKRPRRGGGKWPDFIAIDRRGRVSILECKGTQSSRAALRAAIRTGQAQKDSLDEVPTARIQHRLASGLFVPAGSSGTRAYFYVADPEDSRVSAELRGVPAPRLRYAVNRVSLGKQLAAANMTRAGSVLASGLAARGADLREAAIGDIGGNEHRDSTSTGGMGAAGGFHSTHVLVVPAEASRLMEIRFTTAVPPQLVTGLLTSENIEDTVARFTGASREGWRRRDIPGGREIVSPAGVSFTLEMTEREGGSPNEA